VNQATNHEQRRPRPLRKTTDPLGRSWTYDYNDAGDLVAATSPSEATTT
jgi:YD repeat-containing protein